MSKRAVILAFALTALVCGAAQARVAVVSPVDDRGVPQAYPSALPAGHGEQLPLSWSYVEELIPVVVMGATADDTCDADEPPSLPVSIAQAIAKMTRMDTEGAVELLDQLIEDLPCLDAQVSASELARVYYYRGAALAFLGDSSGAAEAMFQALVIDPEAEPDVNLPPEINDIFYKQTKREPELLPLTLRMPPWATVVVDGTESPPRMAKESAGLIQWQEPDGRWTTVRLHDLHEAVFVGTPSGIQAGLQGADDPHVARIAAALGEALADSFRVHSALLWDGVGTALLWDGTTRTTEWLESSSSGSGGLRRPVKNRPRAPYATDRIRIGVLGGLTYADTYPYGSVGVDAALRVARLLRISAGVDMGFPIPAEREPLVLPMLHAGPRLQFGGKVQPFVGVAARLGFDDKQGTVWGLLAVGAEAGVDIPVSKMLMIRASGEGGMFIYPIFPQGHVHAKIGLVLGI